MRRAYCQILRIGSILLLAMGTLGCKSIAQKDSRGYVESTPVEGSIVPGKTSRDEVQRLLGSASTVSDFPPETWYYITRKRETVAFLAPKLTDQKVLRIEFDAAGTVS